MLVVYSDIIWLGCVVALLTIGALVGLLRREAPGESVEPVVLSQAEREVLLREKIAALQKRQEAKAASKKARRDRRKQGAAGRSRPPA